MKSCRDKVYLVVILNEWKQIVLCTKQHTAAGKSQQKILTLTHHTPIPKLLHIARSQQLNIVKFPVIQ